MIALIVAMDPQGIIGKDNQLPWEYPEDLKYFRKMTTGKSVLMGYNTYLSIINRLNKVLPNRLNYVLTNQVDLIDGAIAVTDLTTFLEKYRGSKNNLIAPDCELFIIGGRSVYQQTIDYVDYLYITRIKKSYHGDLYFPNYDQSQFELISAEDCQDLTFEIYRRKSSNQK